LTNHIPEYISRGDNRYGKVGVYSFMKVYSSKMKIKISQIHPE
jgi:hypothetical protein